MALSNLSFKNFVGTVVEIVNRHKAIVEFQDEQGSKQRALLKVEKFTIKPGLKPDGPADRSISEFVEIGKVLKGLCYKFDTTGEHKCGWFVVEVLHTSRMSIDLGTLTGLCPTMFNKIGCVSHLEKQKGTISYVDDDGTHHDVLLLASKLYDTGKLINVKHCLRKYVDVNDKINFDAVPIDPEENEDKCSWLATSAWKRTKPPIDYESPTQDPDPLLSQIRTIIKNPKSQFFRGKGQIMQILNESYGIAIGAVNKQQTHWQSILFHRSGASLFKYNLGKVDIRQVFKEGDKICFIAAVAPVAFSTQWVASHINIDTVGDARKLVEDNL